MPLHTLKCASPSQDLREYIRAYAEREYFDLQNPVLEPVPARLEPVIEFQLCDAIQVSFHDTGMKSFSGAAVVGPQTHRRGHVVLIGHLHSFGVFFQPSGLSRLFGIPICDLRDKAYAADTLLGAWIRRFSASVVRQADCNLSRTARPRFTFSRMSLALAVQMNGLGFPLCWLR